MVAHLNGVQGVAGSNPVSPTIVRFLITTPLVIKNLVVLSNIHLFNHVRSMEFPVAPAQLVVFMPG